jgi:hypothetical protein
MMTLEQLLSRLENARHSPSGWTAHCPTHEDRRNSLSVTQTEEGKILLNCFAGCPTAGILAQLGLSWPDVFPQDSSPKNGAGKRKIDRVYDYTDELGQLLYQNVRFIPKDFRLRKPGGKGGWTWKLNGARRVLYRLPEVLEAAGLGKTIFLVEGEKDADRLCSLGLVATTSGGAKSWREEFAEFLRGADVIIVPDRDRAGEEYAKTAAQSLQGKAAQVQIVILPLPWRDKNGLDVSDWLQDGHTAQDLLDLVEGQQEPPVSNAWDTAQQPASPTPVQEAPSPPLTRFGNSDELLSKELEPVRWVFPGLITEGLWLLCGKPKMGKSWLALSLCVAQATGGVAFGKVKVEKAGDVLYLPLEDNERRFKSRLEKLLSVEPGNRPSLRCLSYLLECPRLDEGGLDLIEGWLKEHPGARAVVIDTLAKVKPLLRGRSGSLYDEDYRAVQGLKSLADRHQVLIVLIHHLRKASADDVQDTINATTGLAGGVDGTLILQRARGRASATLHIDGRDVPEVRELAINWDNRTAQWTLMGDAEEFRLSEAQAAVVAAIKAAGQSLGPKALLEVLCVNESGLSIGAVTMRLQRMAKAGALRVVGKGKYALPDGMAGESEPQT